MEGVFKEGFYGLDLEEVYITFACFLLVGILVYGYFEK